MTKFRDGQENQSGTIRRDPARVRSRRDDQGTGEETWRAPENGAPSHRPRDPTREEEAGSRSAQTGCGERAHRPDARRPASAAQAAAHRIWTRLRNEPSEHTLGEPTVRRYV